MKLKPDKNFPGRKFAYVTFGTVAQAQAAVMLINSPNFMPGFKAARRPQVHLNKIRIIKGLFQFFQANMYDPNRSGQSESNLGRPNLPYPHTQNSMYVPDISIYYKEVCVFPIAIWTELHIRQ